MSAPKLLIAGALLLASLLPPEAVAQRRGRAVPASTQAPAPVAAKAPSAVEGAAIAFDTSAVSFGRVQQGDLVERTFRFTNTGTASVQILGVKPACGCTVAQYTQDAIKPGEKGTIRVVFNTGGKMGPQQKQIQVSTSGTPGVHTLVLRGEVVSPAIPIAASPVGKPPR